MSAPAHWAVRPVRPDEFDAWTALFRGYAAFYEVPTSDEHQRCVWGWIHDGAIDALVAVELDETGNEVDVARGLAHLRAWHRPLRGTVCGFLDDLFVDPDHRGRGAVDALFRAIDELARERGWPLVRWLTADDNARAQAVYDRVAARTSWVTYDMTVGE